MNEQDALSKALEFLKREKIATGKHKSTRFEKGEDLRKFSERMGEKRPEGHFKDVWEVSFENTFKPPADELWGDDDDIIIEVEDKTGKCCRFR
jgi:hypothetical protein